MLVLSGLPEYWELHCHGGKMKDQDLDPRPPSLYGLMYRYVYIYISYVAS